MTYEPTGSDGTIVVLKMLLVVAMFVLVAVRLEAMGADQRNCKAKGGVPIVQLDTSVTCLSRNALERKP